MLLVTALSMRYLCTFIHFGSEHRGLRLITQLVFLLLWSTVGTEKHISRNLRQILRLACGGCLMRIPLCDQLAKRVYQIEHLDPSSIFCTTQVLLGCNWFAGGSRASYVSGMYWPLKQGAQSWGVQAVTNWYDCCGFRHSEDLSMYHFQPTVMK